LRGSEALVGLQNIVTALGEDAFHFLVVAGDFEPSGAVLERVESGGAGVAFLEGPDFAFNNGGSLEDAFFDALAEGGRGGEESRLGAGNHGFFLEAALGAAAQDQMARGVLGIGDFFHLDTLGIGASREGFEGLIFKRVGILAATAARDVDDVRIAALFEQGEVGARGESGVEDASRESEESKESPLHGCGARPRWR